MIEKGGHYIIADRFYYRAV